MSSRVPIVRSDYDQELVGTRRRLSADREHLQNIWRRLERTEAALARAKEMYAVSLALLASIEENRKSVN
jgi:hypothetical protein